MLLSKIIAKYPILNIKGSTDIDITGIEHNSKKIVKGNLFIAQKGYNHDGHDYILNAIEKGAIAIVKDKDIKIDIDNITIIDVYNSTDALGYFSSKFYKDPWNKLCTIGITGTNGKTTTSYIIRNIIMMDYKRVGIIGTMGVVIGEEFLNVINTTPDSLEIQKSLYNMVDKNLDCCIIEVSSHGLEMKRVKYIDFNIGIFTNLSREHLDYHKDMENYYYSKSRLFLKTNQLNIINKDDIYGKRLLSDLNSRVKTITYGFTDADIYPTNISYKDNKPCFVLNTPKGFVDIELSILGEFNIYNALAAAACCYGMGIDNDTIKIGLESFKGIKGRFEFIETNLDFDIIIDFAHTPDGMEKTLKTISTFNKGRIITIFGAGGDRDKLKRPEMGRIAGKYSDMVIVTSDNPRFEDPAIIANEIASGIIETHAVYITILDRKEAINYAIINAMPKDTILIAGKGHEDTMNIKGIDIPFDEREIILNILKKM